MDERPELAELVENVRTNKWHELGLQLNVEDNGLVAIRRQCHHIISECRREMFSNWLSNATNASRKQILKALRTRAVSEVYMAKQYELYISQLPPTTANTVHDDLNIQKPVSQCTVTNTSGTAPLTNIPKSHTTKKPDVIKDDTQTNERSKNIVISESNIPPTQQNTLCSKTTIGAIAIDVLPTQKTLCSKTTIGAIAISIGFLAIVIGLVFTNSEGKGEKIKVTVSERSTTRDGGIIEDDDLPNLLIYSNVISDMNAFCTYIHIPVADCSRIKEENPHSVINQMNAVLRTWLDRDKRTWKEFVIPFALLNQCVKAKELATEYSVYFDEELSTDLEVLKKCKDINNH